jgi:hypothetical protein
MNTLAQLKKNRQSNLSDLTKKIEEMNSSPQQQQSNNNDDNLWKPSVGKDGNGYAVIRFLPPPKGEEMPFVRIWDHGFQGPGGWYIEKSLTTLGEKDPVSELNTQLWNTGREEDKNTARQQKRRLSFYSNIYVVKDPDNPQNEGKVFLYKYGKRIFDKLNDVMNPQFDDEKPVNPFDFWEGANFRLKIRKVDGYWNYDKSEFDSGSPLADDDQLEGIWEQQHSLQDLTDPKNFKSYDELQARLNRVLNIGEAPPPRPAPVMEETPPFEPDPPSSVETSSDESDDDLAFFKSLADD